MKRTTIVCLILLLALNMQSRLFSEARGSSLTLEQTIDEYVIANNYYKAHISKRTGIVKHLYIMKDESWVGDLVYQATEAFGLGYLEGVAKEGQPENSNCATGLQYGHPILTILESTVSSVRIRVDATVNGMDFREIWTFWSDAPYFMSEALAVEKATKRMVNQDQFCWMINNTWQPELFGTNYAGDVTEFMSDQITPLFTPKLDTYPWVNYQFVTKNASLGYVFVYTNDPWAIQGQTGDWREGYPFEYQVTWFAASGSNHAVSVPGLRRELTTVYYVTDSLTNDCIRTFARTEFLLAPSRKSLENPNYKGGRVLSDPYWQNPGNGSVLLNSPYFTLRQNAQWSTHEHSESQWKTEISPPLYTMPATQAHYHLKPMLEYSLWYSNGTSDFQYGMISQVGDGDNSVWNYARSSDGKVAYNSTFETWNDSDKLMISGYARNASASASIQKIWIELSFMNSLHVEAESTAAQSALTSALNSTDDLWTNYSYSWASGTALIYRDAEEDVPILRLGDASITGTFRVFASVKPTDEPLRYFYSWDNSTWNTFTTPSTTADEGYLAYLGSHTFSNGFAIYINDNDTGGSSAWQGWDALKLLRVMNLDSLNYDFQYEDQIYGNMGASITIHDPKSSATLFCSDDGSGLRIYLYNETSPHKLTTFELKYNLTIWSHRNWLSSAIQIASLHTKEQLTYDSHIFEGITWQPENDNTDEAEDAILVVEIAGGAFIILSMGTILVKYARSKKKLVNKVSV